MALVIVVALGLFDGRHSPAAEDAAAEPSQASEAKPDELSPEDVARRFFAALLTRDEATIKQYTIPSPGSDILWRGPPPSDQTRAAVKERMAALKFRRLKVGDKVTGPGGKEYTVHPVQVNEGRMLLLPEGFTLPFTLVHSDLGWRVKVDGLIAARQAAEKEEKKSTAPVER
ncbi:MAG TPA: hypothetical protein VIK18_15270 [Pirellulales bacterium]